MCKTRARSIRAIGINCPTVTPGIIGGSCPQWPTRPRVVISEDGVLYCKGAQEVIYCPAINPPVIGKLTVGDGETARTFGSNRARATFAASQGAIIAIKCAVSHSIATLKTSINGTAKACNVVIKGAMIYS